MSVGDCVIDQPRLDLRVNEGDKETGKYKVHTFLRLIVHIYISFPIITSSYTITL